MQPDRRPERTEASENRLHFEDAFGLVSRKNILYATGELACVDRHNSFCVLAQEQFGAGGCELVFCAEEI